jgi:DNA-binding transcriptional ArsR family regulator
MSRVFTALGDEHRQRILMLFDKGERLNVGQIAAVSTLTRSTVSHHLKILREADVLHSEKLGKAAGARAHDAAGAARGPAGQIRRAGKLKLS